MDEPLAYSAAFLIGLIGSPHCVGMCGGIASLLATKTGSAAATQDSIRGAAPSPYIPIAERSRHHSVSDQAFQVSLLLLFQIGRIACYAILGALAGGLVGGLVSASSFVIEDLAPINIGLRLFASALLVMIALSIFGWDQLSQKLESIGGRFWKFIQPFSRQFLPIDQPRKALLIGLLWGFLPCGLIYSALAWSAMAGQAGKSALLMFCFGLGTLPAVLSVSIMTNSLRRIVNRPATKRWLAIFLMAIALLPWLPMNGHDAKGGTPIDKGHSQHSSHAIPQVPHH